MSFATMSSRTQVSCVIKLSITDQYLLFDETLAHLAELTERMAIIIEPGLQIDL